MLKPQVRPGIADVELPTAVKRLGIMSGLDEYWDWDPSPSPEASDAALCPGSKQIATSAPQRILTGADQDSESSCAGAEASC